MCPVGIAIQSMDCSDGLRVNCKVRGGEPSVIISSKGPERPAPGSDLGVRVEQKVQVGGLVGRLGQQGQDYIEERRPRGHRTEGAVTLAEVLGVGEGDISSLPDGIPSCWARGPLVTMSSTPCLGPGFSLHLGPSSNPPEAALTVGRLCGSGNLQGPCE